ncbi:mitogen-activated protein kinase kinase kinase 3-like [Oncorhynchus keta]|uniref:mitogen-activated protein kinase kinase kinase 3-like n=1 Tax=Oncorhynchus keta TaxID=8018 RepID=UPI00227CC326|nr:mitogen-activated protein kinase kinase kinase 3-like [Oncorhynchus keta]
MMTVNMDDEEALNSIMKDLAALGRCYAQKHDSSSHKPKPRTLLYKQDLRVKLEHEREKRIIPFQRPLKIKELLQKVTEAFGQQMDLFYTDKERLVPLKSQEDLDRAVFNVGSSSLLRLLLKTPKNNHFLQVGSWDKQSELRSSRSLGDLKGCTLKSSERVRKHSTGSLHAGRRSPPPGSVPEEQQQIARQGSFTSIHTEGEFIPEGLDHKLLEPFRSAGNSLSSSCQSIDQALDRLLLLWTLYGGLQPTLRCITTTNWTGVWTSVHLSITHAGLLKINEELGEAGLAVCRASQIEVWDTSGVASMLLRETETETQRPLPTQVLSRQIKELIVDFRRQQRREHDHIHINRAVVDKVVTYTGSLKCSIHTDMNYRDSLSEPNSRTPGRHSKGGTFPRQFHLSNGSKDYSDGRRTFPRSFMPQENLFQLVPSSQTRSYNGDSTLQYSDLRTLGRVPEKSCPHREVPRSPQAPVNWRQGKLLGRGAFGEVYLCYDADTGRELAAKQVPFDPDCQETSKEVNALECEVQLLKNLHHERIVQYYGSSRDLEKRKLTIFVEFMPGGSIKDQLKAYGALTEKVTRRYTRQILQGLFYLHSNMIVHRDIKGLVILTQSNMIVHRDINGLVILTDLQDGVYLSNQIPFYC